MNDHIYRKLHLGLAVVGISLFSSPIFSAQKIDLSQQALPTQGFATRELSKATDQLGVTHIRKQQLVNGYPVWGGDYIVHIANGSKSQTMNGLVYKNLEADLANSPSTVFTAEQKQKALDSILKSKHLNLQATTAPQADLIVYLDKQNQAHWAYHIRIMTAKSLPSYIIDAVNFDIYQQWDDLKTYDNVTAGGLGGNPRITMQYYDGTPNHLPTFTVQRNASSGICYMRNDKAVLRRYADFSDIQFNCVAPDRQHNGLYWDSQEDGAGGGYSPSNDTLYASDITWSMFQNWFNMPVWKDKNGKAKRLVFLMHSADANAAFHNDGYIVIGDALHTQDFYPFTTIDIVAHEMGHGVTLQNANLDYYGQSGGINESFSDMTGKTAEYYVTGRIKNWNIGAVMTDTKKWIRYMDHPSMDCEPDDEPGRQCSIEKMSQIPEDGYMDVHYASGLYNRFFYLLSIRAGWGVKKVYQLMLHANQYYWTQESSFCQASRGVVLAATELGFDAQAVIDEFVQVGLDPKQCS